MRRVAWIVFVAALLFAVSTPAQETAFQVVVHESNSVESLTIAKVGKLFLRKTTHWESGLRTKPVDQTVSSPVREAFSEAVHDRGVRAIKAYWQKLLFSGRSAPPPELASDRDVLDYVRGNSGGIGYVSVRTELGTGVKRLLLTVE